MSHAPADDRHLRLAVSSLKAKVESDRSRVASLRAELEVREARIRELRVENTTLVALLLGAGRGGPAYGEGGSVERQGGMLGVLECGWRFFFCAGCGFCSGVCVGFVWRFGRLGMFVSVFLALFGALGSAFGK